MKKKARGRKAVNSLNRAVFIPKGVWVFRGLVSQNTRHSLKLELWGDECGQARLGILNGDLSEVGLG